MLFPLLPPAARALRGIRPELKEHLPTRDPRAAEAGNPQDVRLPGDTARVLASIKSTEGGAQAASPTP